MSDIAEGTIGDGEQLTASDAGAAVEADSSQDESWTITTEDPQAQSDRLPSFEIIASLPTERTSGSPPDSRSRSSVLLREGDPDPYNPAKKIEYMVQRTPFYQIFLNEDLMIRWKFGDRSTYLSMTGPNWAEILNRLARLEAMPIAHLSRVIQFAFRRQLGEAIARGIHDDTEKATPELIALCDKAALEGLSEAEAYLRTRNAEVARQWYLEAGLVGLVSAVLFLLAVALFSSWIRPYPDRLLAENLLYAAGFGALGAGLSQITRLGSFPVDPGAGVTIYRLESAARFAAGIVGGVFVSLLLSAQVIGAPFTDPSKGRLFALALSLVAGASERMVPNIIGNMEKLGTDSGPPPPQAASAAEKPRQPDTAGKDAS